MNRNVNLIGIALVMAALALPAGASERLVVAAANDASGAATGRIQGSGTRVDESRQISGFSRLMVDGPIDVVLKAASAERVTLRADDNIAPLIETKVVDGRLEIGVRPGVSFSTRHRILATIEFTRLDGVELRGSGDLRADTVKAQIFEATMHGQGDVKIGHLDVSTLAVLIAGSGDFSAAGAAQRIGVVLRGSGDVRVQNVAAQKVAVQISGSGDVLVHAAETLDVRIDGSGDVRYRGAPRIDKQVHGSGEVSPLR